DDLAAEASRNPKLRGHVGLRLAFSNSLANLLDLLPRQKLAVRLVLRSVQCFAGCEQLVFDCFLDSNAKLLLSSDSSLDAEHRVERVRRKAVLFGVMRFPLADEILESLAASLRLLLSFGVVLPFVDCRLEPIEHHLRILFSARIDRLT